MPALNEIIAAKGFGRRATGGKYAAMKKLWTTTVAGLAAEQGLTPWEDGAHIRLTLAEPNKRRDPDGACSGAGKFALDGLVTAGVLPNDGWGHVLSLSYRWFLDPKEPGVRVLLSDVEHG
jgi:hypothetical protein